MATSVLNISKKVKEDLIPAIERSEFFRLNLQNCNRHDLFNFALALGYKRGYQTDLNSRDSLIRSEAVGNNRYMYDSVFFSEMIEDKLNSIDMITNENEVFSVVEQYANTGFSVIKDKMNSNVKDEDFLFELIADMDVMFKEFRKDFPEGE